MRAAIKTLADVILVGFGVLLLVLLLVVVIYFRVTTQSTGSGGIGAVSVGVVPIVLLVLCVGIAGVFRLVYLVSRRLLHAARPSLERSRTRQHDQPGND